MRKLLISILLVLLIIMVTFCIKDGINIGPLHVLGVEVINNKNEELTQKINETKTANDNYTESLNKLKQDIESLTKSKEACLSLINISTDSQLQEATQTKNYTIEYLWSRVGNHATQEGVKIKMDITSGTIYRNLKFTVTGNYLAITNFITALENDSNLEFTIDEFSMTQNECTFTVKNVKIQQETSSKSSSSTSGVSTNTNSTQTSGTINNTTNDNANL